MRLAVGVDRLLLGGQLRLGRLTRRRQLVGLEHPLEHLVFERLDLGLRELDFLLDRRGIRLLVFTAIACRGTSTGGPGGRRRPFRSRGGRSGSRRAAPWRRRRAGARPRGASSSAFTRSGSSASRRWAASAAESSRCRAISRSRSAFIGVLKPKKAPALRTGLEPAVYRLSLPSRSACSLQPVRALISLRVRASRLRCSLRTVARAQARAKVGPPGFEPGTGRL